MHTCSRLVQACLYVGLIGFLIGLLPRQVGAEEPGFLCGGIPEREQARRAKMGQSGPANGMHRVLAIFATFKGEGPEGASVPSYAKDLFNPDVPGSFSHFFRTMSGGTWEIEGVVLDRLYISDKPASAYLNQDPFTNEGGYGIFNEEILKKVDRDIDFSQFDNDGPDGMPHSGDDDGYVDFVFMNILGAPRMFFLESATGIASLGSSSPLSTNDKVIIQYGTSQRVWSFAHAVGIMAHEYSHIALNVDLPDLYDLSFLGNPGMKPEEDGAGIGSWGLMGFGVLGWNGNDGPNPFSAWSLMQLGWVKVVEIEGDSSDVVIEDVRKARKIYKLPVQDHEYFLIEHRRRLSSFYDRNMPAEGLLIWHVDEQAGGNGDERHKKVDLECADGLYADAGYPLGTQPDPGMGMDNLDFWAHDEAYRIEHGGNTGDATDVFDGLRFTSFSHRTNPHSNGYSTGKEETAQTVGTGIAVTNLRPRGDVLMADVYVNHWSGPISGHTEWRGEVRVFGDVTVEADAVLSLHPEMQIRVAPSDETRSGVDPERVEIRVAGGLQMEKQGARRSRFRPFLGEEGNWYGIRLIQDGAWVDLIGVDVERAVYGLSGADVAADIRLSNSSITRSAGDGIHLQSWRGNVELLTGTVLSRNEGYGLYVQGEGEVNTRSFRTDSNKGAGGYLEGVRVKIVSSQVLRNKGDGIVLRAWEEADIRSTSFIENGGVGLHGVGSEPLQLGLRTSFKDNLGGGLWAEGGPILAAGARFEGNGTEEEGFGLRAIGASGWIRNGTFKNEARGAWISSSPLQLSESTFEDNHIALLCDEAPLPNLSGLNVLVGNVWSVRNETSLTLTAGQNWWGTSDISEILEGIYGDVDWRPLLASAPRGQGLTVDRNIPNPFGSSTAIRFQVPQDPGNLDRERWIALRVYNARGQWIRTLVDGIYAPGYYIVPWDGRDADGRAAASGVYVYRVSLYEQRGIELLSASGRMLLIR